MANVTAAIKPYSHFIPLNKNVLAMELRTRYACVAAGADMKGKG